MQLELFLSDEERRTAVIIAQHEKIRELEEQVERLKAELARCRFFHLH